MEPTRDSRITLVDLLDRILDKGLVISADIIISVAGIPLIGVNLRAALAGMETMIKYGVMKDWDEKLRSRAAGEITREEIFLLPGEKVLLEIPGSFFHTEGIYVAWRYGQIYLTDRRLFIRHREFNEVMFQTPLNEITGLLVRDGALYLVLADGRIARLRSPGIEKLETAVKEATGEAGFFVDENIDLPIYEGEVLDFLSEGETVTHRGKAWHLVSPEKIWKPGRIYITNRRLCWWYDFEKRLAFDLPMERVLGSTVEVRDLSPALKKERVFDVIYEASPERKIASFSGEKMYEWERALGRIISFRERTETCPRCGKTANLLELLEKGCGNCGWVSPVKDRKKQRIKIAT
ncbi:MAG: gas vesicle protein [Candidatus Euphemobacter frigidus]|nr:gas vesicle protein [Candidatus Euphemobacter frigidus]MDP8274782.1 gas vesicle protein [Candidatus Euphemobacter frigidus]